MASRSTTPKRRSTFLELEVAHDWSDGWSKELCSIVLSHRGRRSMDRTSLLLPGKQLDLIKAVATQVSLDAHVAHSHDHDCDHHAFTSPGGAMTKYRDWWLDAQTATPIVVVLVHGARLGFGSVPAFSPAIQIAACQAGSTFPKSVRLCHAEKRCGHHTFCAPGGPLDVSELMAMKR